MISLLTLINFLPRPDGLVYCFPPQRMLCIPQKMTWVMMETGGWMGQAPVVLLPRECHGSAESCLSAELAPLLPKGEII